MVEYQYFDSKLVSVVAPHGSIDIGYADGRVGQVIEQPANETEAFDYDLANDVMTTTVTRRDGLQSVYTINNRLLLESVSHDGGAASVEYDWDLATRLVTQKRHYANDVEIPEERTTLEYASQPANVCPQSFDYEITAWVWLADCISDPTDPLCAQSFPECEDPEVLNLCSPNQVGDQCARNGGPYQIVFECQTDGGANPLNGLNPERQGTCAYASQPGSIDTLSAVTIGIPGDELGRTEVDYEVNAENRRNPRAFPIRERRRIYGERPVIFESNTYDRFGRLDSAANSEKQEDKSFYIYTSSRFDHLVVSYPLLSQSELDAVQDDDRRDFLSRFYSEYEASLNNQVSAVITPTRWCVYWTGNPEFCEHFTAAKYYPNGESDPLLNVYYTGGLLSVDNTEQLPVRFSFFARRSLAPWMDRIVEPSRAGTDQPQASTQSPLHAIKLKADVDSDELLQLAIEDDGSISQLQRSNAYDTVLVRNGRGLVTGREEQHAGTPVFSNAWTYTSLNQLESISNSRDVPDLQLRHAGASNAGEDLR